MIKPLVCLFVFVIALSLSDLRAQPAANPPPTTQQLQQILDSKQYQDVIRQSQRVLSLKGAAAKDVDRYDTMMIRAEAQLQMRQQANAMESYREAIKATNDPEKQGQARAMMALLQKSRAFAYTPKPAKGDPTHPATPLNILDPSERKTALKALFDDEWKPNQAKIDALKKQGNTSLTPIIQAAGIAGEMRGLEIAATGSDAQTSTALSDLTDNAAKMMTDYLDRQTKRVDDIDVRASRPADDNINGASSRMGLTAPQTSDLKDTIATCQKLQLAASQVAAAAGSKGADFKSIAQRAQELGKRADDVLTADYNSTIQTGQNMPIQRGGQQTPYQPGQIPPMRPGQQGR